LLGQLRTDVDYNLQQYQMGYSLLDGRINTVENTWLPKITVNETNITANATAIFDL